MTQGARAARPSDSKEALLLAAQAAVDDTRWKGDVVGRSTHSSRVVLLVAAGALFGLSLYLLAVRPTWFFTPPLPPEPVEVQEASVRLTLAREADRIRQFQLANGRLPETLAEAGGAVTGMVYERRDDGSFAIQAPFGSGVLELRSTDPLDGFLGDSWQVIMNRGR